MIFTKYAHPYFVFPTSSFILVGPTHGPAVVSTAVEVRQKTHSCISRDSGNSFTPTFKLNSSNFLIFLRKKERKIVIFSFFFKKKQKCYFLNFFVQGNCYFYGSFVCIPAPEMGSSPAPKRRRTDGEHAPNPPSPVVVFAHGLGAPSSSDWMTRFSPQHFLFASPLHLYISIYACNFNKFVHLGRWKELLTDALGAVEVITFDYPCKIFIFF